MNDVRVVLRNPLDKTDTLEYMIHVHPGKVGQCWLDELTELLRSGCQLNKDYCFLGFPDTARDLDYLCSRLNTAAYHINTYDWKQHGLEQYVIEDWFSPDVVRFGPEYQAPADMYPEMLYHSTKHSVMNRLHNHFERLQGTVENPSAYFQHAPEYLRKYIGVLNISCHEIENLVLSQRKALLLPEWIRPSQITTWYNAPRKEIVQAHREECYRNGYDRKFGHVYMHWAQIGKTLFEVFRDEDAPALTAAVCEAVTHLKYYSGEFDIEWGQDVVMGKFKWHDIQMSQYQEWLIKNGYDLANLDLMLGYVPLGQVDLVAAFGSDCPEDVWPILSRYLDIYQVECQGVVQTYDYCWSDSNV
jgi:hypothetical protein